MHKNILWSVNFYPFYLILTRKKIDSWETQNSTYCRKAMRKKRDLVVFKSNQNKQNADVELKFDEISYSCSPSGQPPPQLLIF